MSESVQTRCIVVPGGGVECDVELIIKPLRAEAHDAVVIDVTVGGYIIVSKKTAC